MSENLFVIQERIRRYERQAELRDRIVFWGVMAVSALLFALGAW